MKKKKGSFEKKLKAYSAAAAGTLLLAPSAANAAIQYTNPPDITINAGNSIYGINFDGGNIDFNVFYNYASNSDYGIWIDTSTTTAPITGGTGIIGTFNGIMYGANLPSNYLVQNTLPGYSWIGGAVFLNGSEFDGYDGYFLNSTGCIGVKLSTAGGTRYGWIRYQGVSRTEGLIHDWAYEDTGAPIRCFDTSTVPAPTLNQWGLIILIALLAGAGVGVLRKQKKV